MTAGKYKVELEGVPETQLWTLYHRAVEARRPDSVLDDPRAVELVEAIDYPFAENFGTTERGLGQIQALRVKAFDEEIRRFLRAHPHGTVVALGEGLETQFWRVDNGRVRWLGVDVPESVELRHALLPAEDERRRALARSALDTSWMDEVDAGRGVLITAQGLFMYFRPPEVRGLMAACAARFPGGGLVFDAMPRWMVTASQKGLTDPRSGFRLPAWHWSMDPPERAKLRAVHPNITTVREVPLPHGRGPIGLIAPYAGRVPLLNRGMPSITYLGFGG